MQEHELLRFVFYQESRMMQRSCLACCLGLLASLLMIGRRLAWVFQAVTSCWLGGQGTDRFSGSEGRIKIL